MKLKDLFIGLLIVGVSLIAGAALDKCQSQNPRVSPAVVTTIDTLTIHDTITIAEPVAVGRTHLRTDTVYLPIACRTATEFAGSGDGGLARCSIPQDCIAVEIPIEQKEYGDTLYHAWVSGYNVSLDSIRIFKRTDIVRIRDKLQPHRWHVGPTVGYGMTPQGLKPFLGVSITYSIFSF